MAPQDPHVRTTKWSNALFSDRRYPEAAVMADEAIRLAPDEPLGFPLLQHGTEVSGWRELRCSSNGNRP